MEQEHSKKNFSRYIQENQNYPKMIDLSYFNVNKALSKEQSDLIKQMLTHIYGDNIIICKKALVQQTPVIRYDVLHGMLSENIKQWENADHKALELYNNGYAKQSLTVYSHCFDKMLKSYNELTELEMAVVQQSLLSTMLCCHTFDIYKNSSEK